jgi:hypothetical protein
MKLVLDTSSFFRDPFLEKVVARKIRENLHLIDGELLIPAVVLTEILEGYEAQLQDVQKSIRRIGRLTSERWTGLPSQFSDDELQKATHELEEHLKSIATIVPYPDVGHQKVVARLIRGKKPFRPRTQESSKDDGNKEKGYKDYLIWRSLVEHVLNTAQSIAFISSNTDDFADSSKSKLHPDLIEELIAEGGSGNEVFFFSSLHAFASSHIDPALQRRDEVRNALLGDTFGSFRLKPFLEGIIPDVISGEELVNWDFGLPSYCEEPFRPHLWDVVDLDVGDVRRVGQKTLNVGVEVTAKVLMNFYMHKGEAIGLDEELGIWVSDWDWNEHYAEGEMEIKVRFLVSLALDEVDTEASSYEVIEFDII